MLKVPQPKTQRSCASRVGQDDLGANPERVSRIRADWEAAR